MTSMIEKAPDFELPADDGQPWRLSSALQRGAVLVVFYRGDW
jgi:peroxiredoxin